MSYAVVLVVDIVEKSETSALDHYCVFDGRANIEVKSSLLGLLWTCDGCCGHEMVVMYMMVAVDIRDERSGHEIAVANMRWLMRT